MKTHGDLLAVIPARGESKGLPGKNVREMKGKPLIAYTIEAALQSQCVSEVVVSTDSEEIAHASRLAGAQVPFLRPAELATDDAKSIDVLRHAVSFYEQQAGRFFSNIVLLQPTSPLRRSTDIEGAFAHFTRVGADSLQSVTPVHTHPYLLRELEGERLQPYLKEEEGHLRRQDLQELYVLNGAIYIMKRDLLMKQNQIVGANNTGFIMPKERSIDIDDLMDFRIAELLIKEE
ncbi:CMP-N,N'-diacetyllegionaminic acid synthase [compost metagenome]